MSPYADHLTGALALHAVPLDETRLVDWIVDAKAHDCIAYYRGHLGHDRCESTRVLSPADCRPRAATGAWMPRAPGVPGGTGAWPSSTGCPGAMFRTGPELLADVRVESISPPRGPRQRAKAKAGQLRRRGSIAHSRTAGRRRKPIRRGGD
jgi:hypothetical protein